MEIAAGVFVRARGGGGGAWVKSACIMNEFMNANIKLNAKELVPCLPLGKPQNT